MTADALLYYPLVGVLRLFQRFRKESPVEPHARETRDYERLERRYCSRCHADGKHRVIEWLPDRVTTKGCLVCGLETTLE